MTPSRPSGPSELETSGLLDTLDLHVSHDCNMRCTYCYASGGSFGRERRMMPLEVATRAVDLFLDRCLPEGLLNLCFDGGEPLLAFGRMREIAAYALESAERAGRVMSLSVGTNGTVVSDEIGDFLRSNRFGTQISLDGSREAHDQLRRFSSGRGSFDSLMSSIEHLKACGVHLAGRITLTPYNLDLAETVELMHELGFIRIAAFPATSIEGDSAFRSQDVDRILSELDVVAERFLELHLQGQRLLFSNLGDKLRDLHMAKRRHWSCGAGRMILSVDPSGDLYPCHRFVGNPALKLGSLEQGIDPATQQRFLDNTVLSHSLCTACWARYLCGGGCAVDSFFHHGRLDAPYEPMCQITRHEIELAIFLYAELRSRAPDVLDETCRSLSSKDLKRSLGSRIPALPNGIRVEEHEGGEP
jgi:uncharacterized protein